MLRAVAGLACRARSNTPLPQACFTAVGLCSDFHFGRCVFQLCTRFLLQVKGYAAEASPEKDTSVSSQACMFPVSPVINNAAD